MPAQAPPISQHEVLFTSVNPWAASHALKDGEVQSATNVDFSVMGGALTARRGGIFKNTVGTDGITNLFYNHNDPASTVNGPMYAIGTSSNLYRISAPNTPLSLVTTLATNVSSVYGQPASMNSYKQYTLIAGAPGVYKDDGTNVTEWIKQVPSAPTITVNTLTPITFTGTYSVPDGTLVASNTASCTFLTGAANTGNAVLAFTSNTNLTLNGTHSIGNFGVFFVDIAFSDPTQVTRVSLDFSIADQTFSNFLHVEINPQDGGVVVGSDASLALINSQLTIGTNTASTVSQQEKLDIWSNISQYNFQPLSFTPSVTNSLAPWANLVTQFSLVGQNAVSTGSSIWSNIDAMRVSVQTIGTCTVTVANAQLMGSNDFPLTDVTSGYYYWQTFATLDTSSNKIDEGAASAPAGPVFMQNSNAKVVQVGTATGTIHGANAVITYRQGGYMQGAYAVHTASYTGALTTFTDTMNDIDALTANFPMTIGQMQPSQFPGYCAAISQAVDDRVFIANVNAVRWTLPGQIGAFPLDSFQEVSHVGDDVTGLLAWNPGLIIINKFSVYEMYGTDFENGQFTLTRTGSRRGSLAPLSIIRTPYGIPLLNTDGITMYMPGYNVDQDIAWFADKFSDMFKGNGSGDPAALKGSRIPAINAGNIHKSVATFNSHKLYIAVPTGNSTVPNTVLVLDFSLKQAWVYTYPYNITSLLQDAGLVWAATSDGGIMVIEVGQIDGLSTGTASGSSIIWNARTKTWSADTTTVLENIAFDSEGTNMQVKAFYDSVNTPVIGTLSSGSRTWQIPPLNGTFVNELAFDINGTQSGGLNAVYQMKFDLLAEPPRVQYYRTAYDEHEWTADKLWDVHYSDIDIQGTSTVTLVAFVDTTAVMTQTMVGPTNGRQVFEFAYPAEIYGRVAYTTYTNTTTTFKHWETRRDARNEPAKINYWRTDIESLEENIIDAFDTDLNPNGTVTATVYIDNVATLTATLTGTMRQSMTTDIPLSAYPYHLYGRTLYVAYTGSGLKHYKTWFHKRPEPDRWTEYISSWEVDDEREIKVFLPEINCLGNTVLATTFLNVGNSGTMTAISTHTMTGTDRTQYTFSLPTEHFGRTARAAYRTGTMSGTVFTPTATRFKHYTTKFDGPKEPPRVTLFRTGPFAYPENHFLKTWQVELDPLNGTVTGTLMVEDVILGTASFTGNRKQWYTVGVDLGTNADFVLNTGSRWEATYSCSAANQFKIYDTKMESDAEPFRKISWSFHYRKIGGASQIDVARYWSAFCDVEDIPDQGPIVGTYWWDIDNQNFCTGTLQFEHGHTFTDRIPFPPGARGRTFEFRLYAPSTIKVHNVNVDMMEEGIKNLTRRGHPGSPPESNG